MYGLHLSIYLPTSYLTTKKSDQAKCWRECGSTNSSVHCWRKFELVQLLWKTIWHYLMKLNIHIFFFTPRYRPRETSGPLPQEMCSRMSKAAQSQNLDFIYIYIFIYLWETYRERQRHTQKEKQAPCRKPNVNPIPGPGITTWAKGRCSTTVPPRLPNSDILINRKIMGGGAKEEEERISIRCPAECEPWDHDLSWNQELDT